VATSREGFKELEKGKAQVKLSILEQSTVGHTLNMLVNLSSYASSDCGSSRGNGWDDVSSNHFCLVTGCLWNLIVSGSKSSTSVNEIYVEVFVIILFESNGFKLNVFDRFRREVNFRKKFSDFSGILFRRCLNGFSLFSLLAFLLFLIYLYLLFDVSCSLGSFSHLTHLALVTVWLHAQVKREQISATEHILEANIVISVERNCSWVSL